MRVRGARRGRYSVGLLRFLSRRVVMGNVLWVVLPFTMISLFSLFPRPSFA
jgi:hypothetical protein